MWCDLFRLTHVLFPCLVTRRTLYNSHVLKTNCHRSFPLFLCFHHHSPYCCSICWVNFNNKMAQRRGCAIFATVLLLGLLHCENVWATTFTVGDDHGWDFSVFGWPPNKDTTFKAGDVLGKYEPSLFSEKVSSYKG